MNVSNSFFRGKYTISIEPYKIHVLSDQAVTSRIDNPILDEILYTVSFLDNEVVKQFSVYKLSASSHLDAIKRDRDLQFIESTDRLFPVLNSLFVGERISLLRSGNRRSIYIGGAINEGGLNLLLLFRIYRGAVRSSSLEKELCGSISISRTQIP